MATIEQERKTRKLADRIERELKKIYGVRMGFVLVTTPFFEKDPIADYISNIQREDAIASLKNTAERLETGEIIPASKGPVQ